MASAHDTEFAAWSWESLRSEFGEAATFTDKATSTAVAVTAIIERGARSREYGERDQRTVKKAVVKVGLDEVSGPVPGDRISFDGDDWFLVDPELDGSACWVSSVVADDVEVKSGPNHYLLS